MCFWDTNSSGCNVCVPLCSWNHISAGSPAFDGAPAFRLTTLLLCCYGNLYTCLLTSRVCIRVPIIYQLQQQRLAKQAVDEEDDDEEDEVDEEEEQEDEEEGEVEEEEDANDGEEEDGEGEGEGGENEKEEEDEEGEEHAQVRERKQALGFRCDLCRKSYKTENQ